MTERGTFGQNEREAGDTKISQLSSVVQSGNGRDVFFIGWDRNDLPRITTNSTQLDERARKSVTENQKAGLRIKEVPYTRIEPKSYLSVGRPVDYADDGQVVAEDLVSIAVIDDKGNNTLETFGELVLLNGIVDARVTWQDLGVSERADITTPIKHMYTIFLKPTDAPRNTAYALMFKSLLDGTGNEIAFRSFMKQSLSKLLILDESQKPSDRKGYIEAAAKMSGYEEKKKRSVLSLFYNSPEDNRGKKKKLSHSFLKVARGLGMYDFSDKDLEEGEDENLPYYDIESLSTEKLIELASDMRDAASAKINGFPRYR